MSTVLVILAAPFRSVTKYLNGTSARVPAQISAAEVTKSFVDCIMEGTELGLSDLPCSRDLIDHQLAVPADLHMNMARARSKLEH